MQKINYTMYTGFSGMIKTEGIERSCEKALQLGFSSVECIAGVSQDSQNAIPDLRTAGRLKEALNEANLQVACHSVYGDVWRNEHAEKGLMREAEIACELGSPFLHHTLLTMKREESDAPDYHEGVRRAVDIAARVADYAKTLGITCIYEDQGRYVNGVEGFGGFYHEMKKRCENVGVCADLGNILFVNEKPEVFLETYIQDVLHVHVKDYLWKRAKECPGMYWMRSQDGSWLRETMVGSGVVDFEACMNILKKNGYQGAIAFENGHPEPFEEGVLQAMEYLNRILLSAINGGVE